MNLRYFHNNGYPTKSNSLARLIKVEFRENPYQSFSIKTSNLFHPSVQSLLCVHGTLKSKQEYIFFGESRPEGHSRFEGFAGHVSCHSLPYFSLAPLHLTERALPGPKLPHVEEDQGDLNAVIRKGSPYGRPGSFSFFIVFIRFWNSNFILDVASGGYGCPTDSYKV